MCLLRLGSPVVRWGTEASATMGDPALSPAVWVSVGVVVNGSILALCLWFIIYRLRATHTNSAGKRKTMKLIPILNMYQSTCTVSVQTHITPEI